MKVLFVLEATLGGTGRHVLDLADGLVARGEEVHLIYSGLRADQMFLSNLELLRKYGSRFCCHAVRMTREVTFADISAYLELSRYVRRHGPFDVIHSHSTKAGFLVRILLNRAKTRAIYTPHGLMTLNSELTGLRRLAVCCLESVLAHFCDTVVAVSANEYRCAARTGIGSKRLIIIPNGIDAIPADLQMKQRNEVRASLGLSPETVCIGSVGRLCGYKEPGRLIKAFALAMQRRGVAPPLRLAIIGWGPLEALLQQEVAELGLARDVLFLGQVDGSAYMPAFDILAHSSRFEGFSYVFLEAMSAGIPVVTTRVGGVDELITHGVTGYVCDPWDAERFSGYLQQLSQDRQLRLTMGDAAKERASRFTAGSMVDSTLALYRSLRNQTNPAPMRKTGYQTLPSNHQ